MELREKIVSAMRETAELLGKRIECDLVDSVVLLESGLDSLGFAILVARLEEELGYDPFSPMAEPFYPRTLAEFVGINERTQSSVTMGFRRGARGLRRRQGVKGNLGQHAYSWCRRFTGGRPADVVASWERGEHPFN